MWWLLACAPARLAIDDPTTPGEPPPPPPLALVVTSPADGAFAGDGPVTVVGRVSAPGDLVWVEDEPVAVGADGTFAVDVDVPGDVRIVSVTAARGDEAITRRRTVYAGADPRDSWPGAMAIRVTPPGLDQLTVTTAAAVDAADLPGAFAALIPPTSLGGFTFTSTGASAGPSDVVIDPSEDVLYVGITLPDVRLDFDAGVVLLPPVPVTLGVEELEIGATLSLATDGDAVVVDVIDTNVDLRRPILEFAGIDPGLLVFLTGGLVSLVGEVIEGALDLGLVAVDELVVPGGTVKTDALGFPLALSLDAVDVDDDGVVALLGVELGGAPAVARPHRPGRDEGPRDTDVLVALHEGLLGALLSGDVLGALDLGTLELPGILGEIVALPLVALPGGGELPADRTGMCVTVGLPREGLGRLRGGLDPFATLILPGLRMETGVTSPTLHCSPWLSAELAVAADLRADGSRLVIDVAVADGAVLDYAAEGAWTESEVVSGLGGLLDAVSTLLGSSLAIDLADLVDPAAVGGTPALSSAPRARDADGAVVPGVVVLGLTIE